MRWLSTFAIGALLLGLSCPVEAGTKGPKGQKAKKGTQVQGVVVEFTKDNDKDSGTLKVKVQAKKKKGQEAGAPAAEEKTFKVTPTTKFETVSGKKDQREVKAATFADVHKGDRVQLHVKGDVAESVRILIGKKKK